MIVTMNKVAVLVSIPVGAVLFGAAATVAVPPAAEWEIGPWIRGKNYSVGMPDTPTPVKGGGWSFQFPGPTVDDGHVHYLTYAHGPLTGKKRIVMRYRIDAKPAVKFVPREYPEQAATLSLYFQRRGDTWKAKGRHVYSRWYAPDAKMAPVAVGTHTITIALNDPDWISVFGGRAGDNPQRLAEAMAETERVGFVMGSASTRGHGVFATGTAKFTLLEFRVE
jgi:hypothetical protein